MSLGLKRIIYMPAQLEPIPLGAINIIMPDYGAAIDVIVEDGFVTSGTILYDSDAGIKLVDTSPHHFAGWEF